MREPELGVAIRFMKAFDEEYAKRITPFDLAIVSCRTLGHTFTYNPDQTVCGVCGAVKKSEEKE